MDMKVGQYRWKRKGNVDNKERTIRTEMVRHYMEGRTKEVVREGQ